MDDNMITARRSIFSLPTLLTIALTPGVFGQSVNKNASTLWIQHARQLQTNDFMEVCGDVFMSPDHMKQQSYLMSDFADEITNLCLKIAPNPDQGTCQRNAFGSLDPSLQNAFFRHAAQHMGKKKMPIDLMMEWGNAGYIVSDKTLIEQNVMRNDLCVEVHESIGDEFIKQIPVSNLPIADLPVQPTKESQTTKKEVSSSNPVADKTHMNNKKDEFNPEMNTDDNFTIVHVEKDEGGILSISGIIAISCAVAAAIALFFYWEARRRNRARLHRMSRFDNEKKSFVEDGVIKVQTSSGSRKDKSVGASLSSLIEDIKVAINDTNWDNVYKLASQIAENDDGLSLPGLGSFNGQNRSHLCVEDQERTKILDDLATNGDWTGLAVTAALYAGETSGSSHIKSDNAYTFDTDGLSSGNAKNGFKNKDIEGGQKSMKSMVSNLSKALNAGNWSQVTKYANLIKEEKNSSSSFDTDSRVLLSNPSTLSIRSTDTSDTEMSKKQTIQKLMRAGKWKGVSIMANMYEMESKQGNSSSPVRPYPSSPTHPYRETRSIVRTKELRHSDRVQENIVGFRRDP